jgi:protein TonB
MRLEPSRAGAAVTIGLHVAVVAALLSYAPARSAILAATPIMVDWIAAPKPEAPPEPPKPRPVVQRPPKPVKLPPVIAARPEVPVPAPIIAPAPPPPAPEPVAVAAPPPPAPVALTAPVFNAAYLDNPAPQYPPLSRRQREQGRVVLHVLVNAVGRADEVEIRTSSGFSRLDDTARETVKRWKFVPAKRGSEPVAGWVLIPISFKLEG